MSNIHKNFSSRTRVGATIRGEDVPVMLEVSIHAPVWVRLFFPCFFSSCLIVSIHAPVWVRRQAYGSLGVAIQFQFTHPCGCDSTLTDAFTRSRGFNSRTRVGATCSFLQTLEHTKFQFTHPCGCDFCMAIFIASKRVSIHAPVWVRQRGNDLKYVVAKFQFTHPCGCDSRQRT